MERKRELERQIDLGRQWGLERQIGLEQSIPGEMRRQIQEKLQEIEAREQVRVLAAVESGSRAWGIASPDSDYDVRFLYVRCEEEYLRLDPPRDVIEWQLDEVLDINGWDLKKALVQLRRGNVTLFEWADSPIVYHSTAEWEAIRACAAHYFSVKAAVAHYYGTANHTYQQYLQGDQVKYKKYFYALRPLLAARWIEERHRPAPVLFSELMNQQLPENLREEIEQTWKIKVTSDEGALHPQNPVLQEFIQGELRRWQNSLGQLFDDRNEDWGRLDRLFLEIVKGA